MIPGSRWERLGPLGRRILPLHLGRGLPPVVALACYFDESERDRHYAMGGYLGTVEVWDHVVTPAWRKVLKDAPRKVCEFKTSDCRQKEGEFKEWDDKETKALTTELVSVLVKSGIKGFSIVMRFPGVVARGFDDSAEQRNAVEQMAYGSCIYACLYDALRYGTELFPPGVEYIQPVTDKKKKFFRRVVTAYEQAIEHSEISTRVEFPISGESLKLPPLQAADLLAYETRKEIESRTNDPRPVSKALERLVGGLFHYARCASFPDVPAGVHHLKDVGIGPQDMKFGTLFRSDKPIRGKGNWGVT